jgi:hypothetical protein
MLPFGNKENIMKTGSATLIAASAILISLASCAIEEVQAKTGELLVTVAPGGEWLHRYSALKKNPPQFAIWAEREDGSFAGTVFATRKVATGTWAFNGGNPRVEALPVWTHRKEGSEDAITGATPRDSFAVAIATRDSAAERRFYFFIEVNHSTDFNASYPAGAKEGEAGYSGGKEGSGQPSILYRTLIDLDSPASRFEFTVIGHGSPDGSDGSVYPDLSTLTTALGIVESVVAESAK